MAYTYILSEAQAAEWVSSPTDAAYLKEEIAHDLHDMGIVCDVDVITEDGHTVCMIWQTV